MESLLHKPSWLKVKLPSGEKYKEVMSIIKDNNLHTVCQEANCPNIGECFCNGTATFMILGNICTRNCGYCNVKHGNPAELDKNEPKNIANAVKLLGLKYVVITSVTRDDLEDGGAFVFAECIKEVKKLGCKVEVLIPDFIEQLEKVEKADVINHNIEVVKSLFSKARPEGNYDKSLELLSKISCASKSGFMIGLGETKEEIIETLKDLRNASVKIITIGQYLRPNKDCLEVTKYYTPEEFSELKKIALNMGFEKIISGPLVRSSYHAGEYL